MNNQNCAVLVHGCHTGALGWGNVVLGDVVNGQLGRIPKGLELMELLEPDALLIGTGASELDGLKEAQAMQNHVLDYMNSSDCSIYDSDKLNLQNAVLDLESQNTPQELENALTYCVENGIDKLYHVSSPFHRERCQDDAGELLKDLRFKGKVTTQFVTSVTNPAGCTAQGTVVVELPHLADLPDMSVHGLENRVPEPLYLANQVKRIFPMFRTGKLPQFLGNLHELVEKYLDDADFSVVSPYERTYLSEGKVIVEQPHRGDDPQLQLPKVLHLASQVKQMLEIYPTGRLPDFLKDLNALIEKFQPA